MHGISPEVTDIHAQYDDRAKKILGHKYILAHILIHTVDEFKGMTPEEVVPCIEGEPLISQVPIEPGRTNYSFDKNGQQIVGLNTENQEILEGLARFDIIFYVRTRSGRSRIIINVEAQKDAPSGYRILNRAVFYVCRMISSQKGRDFIQTNYNDIKRVFSIWICMNLPENCMDYVHLTSEHLLGSHKWKGNLDLLNIVLIGITDRLPTDTDKEKLHRLLNTLFSRYLSAAEKLHIIKEEYDIPVEEALKEEVTAMCNLSYGIEELARNEGISIGKIEGISIGRIEGKRHAESALISTMHHNGLSAEEISRITDKSLPDVQAILSNSMFSPSAPLQ